MAQQVIRNADWAAAREVRRDQESDTRDTLVDAAWRVISKRSYAVASIGEIAAQAAVSRPTFYVYFATKAEVFRSVAEKVRDRFLAAHHHTGPVADDPVLLSQASVDSFLDSYLDNLEILEEIEKRAESDDEIRRIMDEIVGRPRRRTARHLAQLRDGGLAEPVISEASLARLMRAVLIDTAKAIRETPESRDELSQEATTVYLTLAGYRSKR